MKLQKKANFFVHKWTLWPFFLVKTLYIYWPDENPFVLILHVHLVSPHNFMPLYKFLSLPEHFNFSGNMSVTPDISINNMIAVGHSKSYQTLCHWTSKTASRWGKPIFARERLSSSLIWQIPASDPYAWPVPTTSNDDASSPLGMPRKRSLAWTATHMWCTPSGPSLPTTSVLKLRLFLQYR